MSFPKRMHGDPLLDIVAQAAVPASTPTTIAVAYSGGLDSTVLLHALQRVTDPQRVLALHVHHGLQAAAAAWPAHCAAQTAQWHVPFVNLDLDARPPAGDSVEQWARDARYNALIAACAQAGVARLWTAHHADDQIETLLLRLTRGAGLSGLRGIEPRRWQGGVLIERPLLELSRAALHLYAQQHGLRWIDDPSNADPRFARNALRHTVLPTLDSAMPGVRRVIARNIVHWREAADALDELADADLALATAGVAPTLNRAVLAQLTPARRAWAWRAWMSRQGLRAPGTARFDQMHDQLLMGESPQARVDHDGVALMRYRDRVTAVPLAAMQALDKPAPAVGLAKVLSSPAPTDGWRIDLGPGRGRLRIEPAHGDANDDVIDTRWLTDPSAQVETGSQGAYRQRLRANGPSRPLRHLYQYYDVAPWLRRATPVVLVGNDVVFSGAFGNDRSARWRSQTGLRLTWEPDPRWLAPLQAYGYPWGNSEGSHV